MLEEDRGNAINQEELESEVDDHKKDKEEDEDGFSLNKNASLTYLFDEMDQFRRQKLGSLTRESDFRRPKSKHIMQSSVDIEVRR